MLQAYEVGFIIVLTLQLEKQVPKVKGFGPNNPASDRGVIQTLTVWLYSTYSSQCTTVLGAFMAAVGKGLLVRTTESHSPIKGEKFSWGWWQSETLIIH